MQQLLLTLELDEAQLAGAAGEAGAAPPAMPQVSVMAAILASDTLPPPPAAGSGAGAGLGAGAGAGGAEEAAPREGWSWGEIVSRASRELVACAAEQVGDAAGLSRMDALRLAIEGEASMSRLQDDVGQALRALGLDLEEEFIDLPSGYSIDVYLPGEHAAVEVDGPFHFASGSKEHLGSTLIKHRHLRQRGFHLVAVPYWEWSRASGSQSSKMAYLERRLGLDCAAPRTPQQPVCPPPPGETAGVGCAAADAGRARQTHARGAGGSPPGASAWRSPSDRSEFSPKSELSADLSIRWVPPRPRRAAPCPAGAAGGWAAERRAAADHAVDARARARAGARAAGGPGGPGARGRAEWRGRRGGALSPARTAGQAVDAWPPPCAHRAACAAQAAAGAGGAAAGGRSAGRERDAVGAASPRSLSGRPGQEGLKGQGQGRRVGRPPGDVDGRDNLVGRGGGRRPR